MVLFLKPKVWRAVAPRRAMSSPPQARSRVTTSLRLWPASATRAREPAKQTVASLHQDKDQVEGHPDGKGPAEVGRRRVAVTVLVASPLLIVVVGHGKISRGYFFSHSRASAGVGIRPTHLTWPSITTAGVEKTPNLAIS